ncbi:MAG: NfeD family protein [Planctomycetota bacterium]|nr:NfeD family protein [Planctomycetota bacterium]
MEIVSIIIVLIIAALVLFLLEICTPTFGVLAAMGVAALVAAVWLCFTLSSVAGMVLLIILLVTVPIYLVFLVRFLPRTPLGRKLFLKKASDPSSATPEAEDNETLIGKTGLAESLLRPTGAIRIDGRRVIATAESGMIEKGEKVKVIRATGMNVVVRREESP